MEGEVPFNFPIVDQKLYELMTTTLLLAFASSINVPDFDVSIASRNIPGSSNKQE